MYVTPKAGWKSFKKADAVIELVVDSLALVENGGIWDYYNFTETSSLWCSSETKGTNQLQISFDSEDDHSGIKSMVLEFTNNGGKHFKQLFRLRKHLKNQFDIRMD